MWCFMGLVVRPVDFFSLAVMRKEWVWVGDPMDEDLDGELFSHS
jgi:hypothetical protein